MMTMRWINSLMVQCVCSLATLCLLVGILLPSAVEAGEGSRVVTVLSTDTIFTKIRENGKTVSCLKRGKKVWPGKLIESFTRFRKSRGYNIRLRGRSDVSERKRTRRKRFLTKKRLCKRGPDSSDDDSQPENPTPTPTPDPNPLDVGTVELVSSEPCDEFNCHVVRVDCKDLPTREATIRVHPVNLEVPLLGAIIYSSGGTGNQFYAGIDAIAHGYMNDMALAGFENFEIRWEGARGWATGNEARGLREPLCAYTTLAHYIKTELAQNGELVCATGNSGGAMQIGYGLTEYGLEHVIDAAVLSGGPPTSDFIDVCGLTNPCVLGLERERRPSPLGGVLQAMDFAMGWYIPSDNCESDTQNFCACRIASDVVCDELDQQSIVRMLGENEGRDYDYGSTHVSFIEGELDNQNVERAEKYFNEIQSSKYFEVIPAVPHVVHKDSVGAARLRDELIERCTGGDSD